MNRLDFAHRTVKHILRTCDESPDASHDALIFASQVLVDLVPFLDDGTKRRVTPAILKVLHRAPPERRPRYLTLTFKTVLDGDEALRKVVEELDTTNRAARREWFERLKREGSANDRVDREGRRSRRRRYRGIRQPLEAEADFAEVDSLGPRRVAKFLHGTVHEELQADVRSLVLDLTERCRGLWKPKRYSATQLR